MTQPSDTMCNDPILIWGAGAIGGTIGAFLSRAGFPVLLVDAVSAHVEAMHTKGLTIRGPVDAFTATVEATIPAQLSGVYQRILLCVKGQDTRAALDMAVKYARDRIQFGRPIASFQVIQHKLVNMFTEMESLRNQVYEAAWNISAGIPCRALSSMAKVKANSVYHRVCFDAVVIHGDIGWTAEMDVSLYLLRSKDLENDCGGSDFHKERIARELEQRDPAFLMMEA